MFICLSWSSWTTTFLAEWIFWGLFSVGQIKTAWFLVKTNSTVCVCHNEYQSVPPVQQCCFLLCFCDSFWTKVELCIAGLGYTVWDFRATHNSVLVGFNSLLLSAFLWNLQICICQILMKTWSQFGLLCLLNCCKNKFITWFYPKQSTFFFYYRPCLCSTFG